MRIDNESYPKVISGYCNVLSAKVIPTKHRNVKMRILVINAMEITKAKNVTRK